MVNSVNGIGPVEPNRKDPGSVHNISNQPSEKEKATAYMKVVKPISEAMDMCLSLLNNIKANTKSQDSVEAQQSNNRSDSKKSSVSDLLSASDLLKESLSKVSPASKFLNDITVAFNELNSIASQAKTKLEANKRLSKKEFSKIFEDLEKGYLNLQKAANKDSPQELSKLAPDDRAAIEEVKNKINYYASNSLNSLKDLSKSANGSNEVSSLSFNSLADTKSRRVSNFSTPPNFGKRNLTPTLPAWALKTKGIANQSFGTNRAIPRPAPTIVSPLTPASPPTSPPKPAPAPAPIPKPTPASPPIPKPKPASPPPPAAAPAQIPPTSTMNSGNAPDAKSRSTSLDFSLALPSKIGPRLVAQRVDRQIANVWQSVQRGTVGNKDVRQQIEEIKENGRREIIRRFGTQKVL